MPKPRPELLFVSTRFLFPADSGGKIRTAQVLRGMKRGAFSVTLVSPEPPGGAARHRVELEAVCDRFIGWPERPHDAWFRLTRLRHLASPLPIPVASDRSVPGRRVVASGLARRPALVVFDFAHAAVLAPPGLTVPSVLFTHNVESQIFERHGQVARDPFRRWVWRQQFRKMVRYERETLARFDRVVAVSERDAASFRAWLGTERVRLIPTGVDLDFFAYAPPASSERVVFTGSMDWLANIDGMEFLLAEIWPEISAGAPRAEMCVVGRNPPEALVSRAAACGWSFTGFVDDVRPYVRAAATYVIPLRVGGGTRIKAFEALALGCPIVSTALGVEGLPLEPERHYLLADSPAEFAAAVLRLLRDPLRRLALSREGRAHVERHFSFERAARAFEAICLEVASTGERVET